jgi:hypothetical protein
VNILPEGVPPEEWAKLLEAMPALTVPSSPLVRVIAVGLSVTASHVMVDLIAIEVREAGAVIYWRALAARDTPMLMADVAVSDDQGTKYTVAPSEGGGGEREWHGQTTILPPPPPGAKLAVVVESFGPPPFGAMPGYIAKEPVRGPWRFEVDAA